VKEDYFTEFREKYYLGTNNDLGLGQGANRKNGCALNKLISCSVALLGYDVVISAFFFLYSVDWMKEKIQQI